MNLNMFPMRTNEQKRVDSDRRIPLTTVDIFYEFLGNMKGEVQKVNIDENILSFYHNDNGFNEYDKKAIFTKNLSGDNTNTSGLNGFGFKLAIDRILSDTEYAIVYSINDRQKCYIGHFTHSEWMDCDESDNCINQYSTGSYIKIPLNARYNNEINSNKTELLHACLKYLNIKISEGNVDFYWNGELKEMNKICPDNGSVILNYTLGHDSHNDNVQTKPLLLKINNYQDLDDNIKNIIPEIVRIKRNLGNNLQLVNINNNFREYESGTLKLNVIQNNNFDNYNVDILDGCQIYINNLNINYNAITRCLGGKVKDGSVFGQSIYNGKPRFENHISKNSSQYYIPADKTNTKPSPIGESVLKYIQIISKKIYNNSQVDVRPPLSDNLKTEIWFRAFGDKFFGTCFCCQRKLQSNWKGPNSGNIEFGHIIPWSSDHAEHTWRNILPICKGCNGAMGNTHMDNWMIRERSTQLHIYNQKKRDYLNSNYEAS